MQGQNGGTIFPYSRITFLKPAAFALLHLIQDVAKITFYFLANIFTLCLNQDLRQLFQASFWDLLTHLTAIPVGFVGVLFPDSTNSFIGIPVGGLEVVI